ncbi:PucR family transcriptional regulator [Fictibacillus aquaticus]|uniref:PucR family transcriptional regulator n=1 Tax=Fictibacillus aquaticus TaxID=2021314 RepID=A0A235F7V7_9BACL|nr:helix-turn-helix domain-containing protein [Fictibacillus aquaticus]OYD57338.1 PucR family transcriptional regulator [Fictibacillus aquaticus]
MKQTEHFKGTFGSLENLADRISDVLDCPVTIEDRNHRLLAYSTHEDSTDPARIATIIGRRVPEKVINSLWKDGVIPTLQKSGDPLRVKSINQVGLGDRVAVSIRKNEEVLGYIWVLEINKKLDEDDLEVLKQAAQAARSQLLQHQMGTKKKQENQQEFLWKLLTGNHPSEERILEKFQEISILPTLPVSVMILQFEDEVTDAREKDILYLAVVHQRIRVLLAAADGQQMILLVSSNQKDQHEQTIQEFISTCFTHMEERFSITNVKAAYGSLISRFDQTEKSYKEALNVLSIQDKFGADTLSLYGYKDLGIYQFLDVIREKQTRDGYENEVLVKLQEYDKMHRTNLYETLETYLNCDENQHHAAEHLHIHINTLMYRLKRITEITTLNLKSPEQKIMLMIDLKIRKLF